MEMTPRPDQTLGGENKQNAVQKELKKRKLYDRRATMCAEIRQNARLADESCPSKESSDFKEMENFCHFNGISAYRCNRRAAVFLLENGRP